MPFIFLFAGPPPPPTNSLPSLQSIDSNTITVGGFSSGASFATQVKYFRCYSREGSLCSLPARLGRKYLVLRTAGVDIYCGKVYFLKL